MCFRRVGDDLILEQVYQVDFRKMHSRQVLDQYSQNLEMGKRYWYEGLKDKVEKLAARALPS